MIYGFELNDIFSIWGLISTLIFGFFGWLTYDRFFKKQELRKGELQIKKDEIDYAKDTRDYFLVRESDLKSEKDELKEQLKEIIKEAKREREYYREKVTEIRKICDGLQDKFNEMQLAYSREVEVSQNWEKLHRELLEKYNELSKDHELLKADHEKLKKQVNLNTKKA